ncbi:SDR family NAD(P)-dependent oxidoreductase [Brevibacterium aurantiacum]|uniref:SDR family NAD(P)-dependent oxidoreductase n=1 Tax=Brevibacterium aurantiacum TaxID=273384 RepID=A0A4Z0KE38_BREAU|nr:SDR family NAD(P)-dependent oxidoreductase [Brevibacterium aurantiacum]TGD36785.1 SDR family NAD(P)-dependent oxidoreductase [Brevibacterium aurantiacum]
MTDAEHTIVMTGASRGIGQIAASSMCALKPEAHLVLLSRNDSRDLVAKLQAVGGGAVSVVHTELSSLQSVADATDAVLDRVRSGDLPPLRGLVCNAGVQHTNALTETVDGFESTFAVNVLAHHVLVRRLHDHLHPHARVVVTVSDTHFGDFRHNLGMVPGPRWQPVEALAHVGAFADLGNTAAGRTAYSTSKLAAIYLIHEYARRFPTGPTLAGYNPGFVPGTDLARDASVASRLAMRWIMPLLTITPLATTPSKAGGFLADAALGTVKAPSGAYIDRGQVARSSPESYDLQRECKTWEAVETLTAGFLPLP